MRKICSLLLVLIYGALLSPACLGDDSGAGRDQKLGKTNQKKGKRSKPKNSGPAPSNKDNASIDAELDRLLGKSESKATPAGPPRVPDSANSVSAEAPPSSSVPSEVTKTSPSASYSGDATSAFSADDKDDVIIDDQKIPDKTLQAGELNNQAVQALNDKQSQKAIQLLNQALAVDPGYTQGKRNLRVAFFNYAVELYNGGKYAEALPWLEKALAISKQLNRDDPEMKQLYVDCQQAAKTPSKN